MRTAIMAKNPNERELALLHLKSFQAVDFFNLFKEMKGLPVCIRLLDPPLHEFLPKGEAGEHAETNPMLGLRGARLLIERPDILKMQIDAIVSSVRRAKEKGIAANPEIMVPLVSDPSEFKYLKNMITKTLKAEGMDLPIGTMIETPRAAILAGEIAKEADFFSFGTNDLTQTTYGISRDDAKFLGGYVQNGIFETDPFVTLDRNGVGNLMKTAIDAGRKVNPKLNQKPWQQIG